MFLFFVRVVSDLESLPIQCFEFLDVRIDQFSRSREEHDTGVAGFREAGDGNGDGD